ncbi:transcriptional regulator [Burkholderia vietnamiensis]|uniref:transcriptional regulator n=1 Tax=Burkholderia vietnamiensis TaxID=60552 RepID=UPI001592DCA0|nr:YdaS family helix-turn-helix protein [Burkholderia vietnamiensis]
MDKLIAYLNSLSKPARQNFAEACGTTEGYMRKARSAKQKFDAKLCVLIEQNSDLHVTRRDLRDDWAQVWPELADPSSTDAPDDTQPLAGAPDEKEALPL